MSRITITLHIDIPDEAKIATPDVDYRDTAPQFEPPLPDAPPDLFVAVTPVTPSGVCPVHNVPWKVVPAGVSKKNGKPYESFRACPEMGCNQKP